MARPSYFAALLLALVPSIPAAAGIIIVGQPADALTGGPGPFSIGFNGEYQQVYTNSLFSGPITITGLEFFNTVLNTGTDLLGAPTLNFNFSLSTTAADWNSLSSTLANNIGANNTEVFSGSLTQPWAFGDTLSVDFSTPFTYTPGPGANLLLDIVVSGTRDPNDTLIWFDLNGYINGEPGGNTIFGTQESGSLPGLGTVSDSAVGGGFVTGFVETSAAAPEPGAFVLSGLGLIGLQIIRLRRKREA